MTGTLTGLFTLAGVVLGFMIRRAYEDHLDAELLRRFPPGGPGIHNLAAPTTAELDPADTAD